MSKVQVNISFREDIVGDKESSDSFYLKLTPKIKIRPIIDANELFREAVRAIETEAKKMKVGK